MREGGGGKGRREEGEKEGGREGGRVREKGGEGRRKSIREDRNSVDEGVMINRDITELRSEGRIFKK